MILERDLMVIREAAERPSDPAHGTQRLQPRRSRRVRCSAWLGASGRSTQTKGPGHICYDFPVGANASLLEDQLRIGFNARLRRYTRWASLALAGLTDIANGLTYTDELKIQTT